MPTPAEFVAKWQGSTRAERAAAQEHFIDLCRMLGQPTRRVGRERRRDERAVAGQLADVPAGPRR